MHDRLLQDSTNPELVTGVLANVLGWSIYDPNVHGVPVTKDAGWSFSADGVLFVEDPFDPRWANPDAVLGTHAKAFRALGLISTVRPMVEDEEAAKAQTEEMVTEWLKNAASKGHTDLSFEPHNEHVARLYATVDGQRTLALEYPLVPDDGRPPFLLVANTLMRMAGCHPGHYQRAVDGSLSIVNGRRIEVRLAMRPVSIFGQLWPALFARLLGAGAPAQNLDAIGLPPNDLVSLKRLASRRHGLLLITGPTGSGKTTTLYALLRWIQETFPGRHIQTLEDPVEQFIPGITQTEINEAAGLGWEAGLRSLMRTNPDVILIGEIRDAVTAEHAMRLALTGHLVLATLHTNTALETIDRLLDLGVSRHLIMTHLLGAYAQRLLRRVCPSCSTPFDLNADREAMFEYGNLYRRPSASDGFRIAGDGCDKCGAGYKGRLLVSELAVINQATVEAIQADKSLRVIAQARREKGASDLWINGFELCRHGHTALDEVANVLGPYSAYGRTFTEGRESRLA
ncbi:MAG: Flp pilus assembly complex ATPase component TadA [Gammaproteobacteria bacterium]|nr:Flp pilus assembly complex ATPase component TadA [Gammaproteobacteria bacterium]